MNDDGLNLDALNGQIRDDALPKYTKEDFYTDKPYKYLYGFRNDRFQMRLLQDKLATIAKDAGVKGFASKWSEYQRSQRGELVEVSNTTDFPDQPLELQCGNYQCDVHGVQLETAGFNIVVCPHPLMPVKRYKNIDTGIEKTEIAYYRRHVWNTTIADSHTLSVAGKIVELSAQGLNINSENAKDIVKYLSTVNSLNDDKLGEEHSVGRLGWIGGKNARFEHFSPYEDNLRFDGDVCYQHMYKTVREHGSFDKWLDVAREGRECNLITRLMLDASFASVLIEPLGAQPFFVHAWGFSGTGKTVGLMLAASVWADPDSRSEFIKNFNSTGVGQEMIAGFLNSLPFCIDELQVIKDKRDFDQTIYILTEGSGKTRGARSGGTQKTITWSNAIISTGEMPITSAASGGGAMNRVINLSCQKTKLFDDGHRCSGELRENYGFAGRKFVEMLKKEGFDRAKEIQGEYLQQLNSTKDGTTEKQALSASLLLTADKLVTEMFFEGDTPLNAWDIAPMLITRQEADVNVRCYDWLCGEITANSIRFENSTEDNKGEIWGKIDGNVCYFITKKLQDRIQDAGFNYTSFKQWLRQNDKLLLQQPGRDAYRVRIRQILTQCLAIKLPSDDEGTDEDAEEDDEKMLFED